MSPVGYKSKVGQLWPRPRAEGKIYGTPIDEILALGPTSLISGSNYEGLKDYAGFGRRGTLSGAVLAGARDGPKPGFKLQKALDNPANGRVNVSEQLLGSQSARSFMGWFIRDSAAAAHGFLSGIAVTQADAFNVQLVTAGGSDIRVRVQQSDATAISQAQYVGALPANGNWFHMGLAVDLQNDLIELVIDGVSKGVVTGITKDWASGDQSIRWLTASGGNPLDGGGAYLACFERRVTAAEFASIAALT